MHFTNLSSIRALLALALLVLIGGAFAVVGTSGDATPALGLAPTSTTTTTVRSAVGLVSGELAAQSQLVEGALSPTAAPTGGSAIALAASPSSEATTTTTVVETTTTTLAATTTTTTPPTTTTTVAPATTIPETTTTTAPSTTTTTTTTVPETTTTTVVETTTTTSPPVGGVLSEAEARDIFGLYFAAEDVDRAIEVAICESGLNTAAYNPAGYAGLFQHGIAFWDSRAASAGWAGASVYDAHANAAVAAWLVYSSGWQHWPNC